MKVLAVLLLCAFAAVQGRSAVGQKTTALAALGENPYVVHLRFAVATSGLLNTGVGSLISERWVLTAARAVEGIRFVWIRYGVVSVINPSLVTEASTATTSSDGSLALIPINRNVETTANIAPVPLGSTVPAYGTFCGFGANENVPGETLSCVELDLESAEDGIISAASEEASQFDLGAPLVSDGVQVAVLTAVADGTSTFLPVAGYLEWIEEVTGVSSSSKAAKSESDADSLLVKFVN